MNIWKKFFNISAAGKRHVNLPTWIKCPGLWGVRIDVKAKTRRCPVCASFLILFLCWIVCLFKTSFLYSLLMVLWNKLAAVNCITGHFLTISFSTPLFWLLMHFHCYNYSLLSVDIHTSITLCASTPLYLYISVHLPKHLYAIVSILAQRMKENVFIIIGNNVASAYYYYYY